MINSNAAWWKVAAMTGDSAQHLEIMLARNKAFRWPKGTSGRTPLARCYHQAREIARRSSPEMMERLIDLARTSEDHRVVSHETGVQAGRLFDVRARADRGGTAADGGAAGGKSPGADSHINARDWRPRRRSGRRRPGAHSRLALRDLPRTLGALLGEKRMRRRVRLGAPAHSAL
jgi:hypothetical protein